MAAREQWCNDKVSKLVEEDLRIPTLTAIKDHLLALPQDEAVETAHVLDLTALFDCLNVSNSDQIDLACEVLTLCMSYLNLGNSTNRYTISLERALNHPHVNVKVMALDEIQRTLGKAELISQLCKYRTLIVAVIKCIGDEDLYVSKKASEIICQIGRSGSGLNELIKHDLLIEIHEVMDVNEVKRLRVNEVLVDIAKKDDSSLKTIASTGLLSQILQDLDNNDILLKLNIVELLTKLVTTQHGYNYLDSQGSIKKILKITDDDNDPLTIQLCEPGILKFFGHMAHWKPAEILNKYPKVVSKLFANIKSDDLTLLGVSFDTLGHISETNEGKIALDSTGDDILNVLKAITPRIASLPTELRIRALGCLESILRVVQFESRITNIVRKWYYTLSDDPLQLFFKLAQNPFSEIRVAGLGVINAISTHNWGQECFRNTPGFIEFLLDRRSETFKDCKEAKYDIIKNISSSTVFDHHTQTRFQEYVKEGPFYVQAVTEVAIEGQE